MDMSCRTSSYCSSIDKCLFLLKNSGLWSVPVVRCSGPPPGYEPRCHSFDASTSIGMQEVFRRCHTSLMSPSVRLGPPTRLQPIDILLNRCLSTLGAQVSEGTDALVWGAGARGPAATDDSNWASLEVRRSNSAGGNRAGDRSRNARATSRSAALRDPIRQLAH